MDLFTCANIAIMYVVLLTHGFVNHGNPTVYYILCFAVESATLTVIGITAGIFGLVVITLERYVKVVHAIAHRKYYRNWMTKVGVAFPWIFGTIFMVLPSIVGTRVSNGRCLRMAVWPTEAMFMVRQDTNLNSSNKSTASLHRFVRFHGLSLLYCILFVY